MVMIKATNLGVEFPVHRIDHSLIRAVGKSVGGILRSSGRGVNNVVTVKALSDINFQITEGERVGLIGHNGAGKTTLLQALNGGIYPTSGTVRSIGRIVPLLNLGNGAAADFSGLENISLLGLHMGLSQAEIDRNRDDIVEFSELGDFIHLPVRTYSAGMYLRLSFAIATSGAPDILLIDELFGAGDQSFYAKAKARMESLIKRSGILVLSTHSMALIESYCTRALVLDHGRIIADAPPSEAIAFYKQSK
jgi:ABC-type polysaccharide/polyol phosphate transport system ATPase subunit